MTNLLLIFVCNLLSIPMLVVGIGILLLFVDYPDRAPIDKVLVSIIVGVTCISIDAKIRNLLVLKTLAIRAIYSFTTALTIYSAVILQIAIAGRTVSNFQMLVALVAFLVLAYNIYLAVRKKGQKRRSRAKGRRRQGE